MKTKAKLKTGQPWQPYEIRIMRDLSHLTNAQMGLVLRRAANAVRQKRQKI